MKRLQKISLSILLSIFSVMPILAQEVNSTILLEMAPYRHIYNPAFEPITDGYFYFPALSHINLYGGNNSLVMKDVLINKDGRTMWTLNPNSGVNMLDAFRKNTLIRATTNMAILGFGTRIKEDGYLHINIDANIDAGFSTPKGLFQFLLGGGMTDRTGVNTFNLNGLGLNAQMYVSLGVGYSKRQNDQWTWGLKVKLLDGIAYAGMRQKYLDLNASPEEWAIQGRGHMNLAGPFTSLPHNINYDEINRWFQNGDIISTDIPTLLKPSGLGAAFDLGFTYQPHRMVKISASLTDIGAIYWYKGRRYDYGVNGIYNGIGQLNMDQFYDKENNEFRTNDLTDTIVNRLEEIYKTALTPLGSKEKFFAPLTMKLNVGVDAYFCNDILGLSLYNRAMLYNAKVYDELTLGAAVRPCTWFNFGVSYSFLNGKWDNLGAAIGLRGGPFALTLAADYVPLTWARGASNDKEYAVPYKSKGFNVEMGLNIVWGWKKNKDKDKDGIFDKLDMCPATPKGVYVDDLGCPLDTDGDGVPDYLDNCPATPAAAYGLIDDHGCPIDTDGDGVPDYLDECPGTDSIVFGYVDDKGCPLDSDGDGVPDYMDKCPNTPAIAIGYVDEFGCELDSDGDGVPDYCDLCPQLAGSKENKGCPAMKKEVSNIFKKAMQGIQFETGKAVIKKSSNAILDQVANVFIENPTWSAEVQGHTDNVGKPAANLVLSDKRANAVRDYLIKKGVAAERLTAKGYGDTMPIEDNKTSKGRTLNRRVEFAVTYEEKHVETINQYAEPLPADTVPAAVADSAVVK